MDNCRRWLPTHWREQSVFGPIEDQGSIVTINMSSSSEFSFTNRSDEWEMLRSPVKCRCGIIAPMWVAWKEGTADPGRRFIGCSRYKDKSVCCRFFKWCDPPFTERSREVILELKQKIGRYNDKIESLMDDIKKSGRDKENEDILMLQTQVHTLKQQIAKQRSREKKLWIVIVVVVIFFVLQRNV